MTCRERLESCLRENRVPFQVQHHAQMSPFGNLYDLKVVVDGALTRDETIYFQAGTHTDTMSLRFADFERLPKPAIAGFGRDA